MSGRKRAPRKPPSRSLRTQATIRAQRLARFRMAHARRVDVPSIVEAVEILDHGATPERIERARLELADASSRQARLI